MGINGITISVPVSRAWQRQAACLVETVAKGSNEGEKPRRERETKSERESRVFSAGSLIIYRISQRCHVSARAPWRESLEESRDTRRPTHIRVAVSLFNAASPHDVPTLAGTERARERERERERARVFLVAEAKTRVRHVAAARRQDHFRPAFERSSVSPVSMGSAPASGSSDEGYRGGGRD